MNWPKPFSYSLNDKIRLVAMWLGRLVSGRSIEEQIDLRQEKVEKILLVRATFRLGHTVFALPAVSLFRKNFPHARIDFVGGPASVALFKDLPIDQHFCITRRFPNACWAYLALLRQIRSVGYDLSVDLSGSQSAMGSFIVGLSGARIRVGSQGKWDSWFNVRIPRTRERNKYRALLAFLAAMGVEASSPFPYLVLSRDEKEQSKRRIAPLVREYRGPIVGVFVGGRKGRGKRWPIENFLRVILALRREGIKILIFIGPEERSLIGFLNQKLKSDVPLIFEPSLRIFAAVLSECALFITGDSGPMHLACAVGTRTIALFQKPNYKHWAPPENLCRVLYEPRGIVPEDVAKISLAELSCRPVFLTISEGGQNKKIDQARSTGKTESTNKAANDRNRKVMLRRRD